MFIVLGSIRRDGGEMDSERLMKDKSFLMKLADAPNMDAILKIVGIDKGEQVHRRTYPLMR